MKNIFNVYVVMESQEQCDRMKQVCIDNGLPIWGYERAFSMCEEPYFGFGIIDGFAVWGSYLQDEIEVTEAEFLQLLKEYKDGK